MVIGTSLTGGRPKVVWFAFSLIAQRERSQRRMFTASRRPSFDSTGGFAPRFDWTAYDDVGRPAGGNKMTTSITAVFESGVLRPTVPLDLAEGSRVELILVNGDKKPHRADRNAASILAEIAALPTAGGDPRT